MSGTNWNSPFRMTVICWMMSSMLTSWDNIPMKAEQSGKKTQKHKKVVNAIIEEQAYSAKVICTVNYCSGLSPAQHIQQ